jgi:hypothetical protein
MFMLHKVKTVLNPACAVSPSWSMEPHFAILHGTGFQMRLKNKVIKPIMRPAENIITGNSP